MTHRRTHATREACMGHHLQLMGAVLPLFKVGRILEVGPGRAAFARNQLRGKDVTFLEPFGPAADAIEALGLPTWRVMRQDVREGVPGGPYDVVYASHVIEHLTGEELYKFLRDADAALSSGGLMILAAPVLWAHFYADATHKSPWMPHIIVRALTGGFGDPTWPHVATGYEAVVDLAGYEEDVRGDRVQEYVTWESPFWAARSRWLDWLLYTGRRALNWAGVRKVRRNSWLLAMRKG